MNLCVISASKVRSREILGLEADYTKRLKNFKILELGQVSGGQLVEKIKDLEGAALLNAAQKYHIKVALDESGKMLSSKEFSKLLEGWTNHGKNSFAFLLGGAYGLSNQVLDDCDYVWSLSRLTFPFHIARLLTVEQIYRAFCNLNQHPYHK